MRVGNRQPLSDEILSLGFNEADSIKILGLDIDYDLQCLSDCHFDTVRKINKIGQFWGRFNLSLPGRIGLIKTMMLSQISYLGCIITPTPEQFNSMKQSIENFAKGNLNIDKKRLYNPISKGGLGLINLEEFITAQQVTWVKRAHENANDNWSYDIKKLCNGNIMILHSGLVDQRRHPILYNIANSFQKFILKFYLCNNNARDMYICNNPLIVRGRNDRQLLNEQFFRQAPMQDRVKLY